MELVGRCCVSLFVHLTQAVALQVELVGRCCVSFFVHLKQAVASLSLYVGCSLVPVSSGNVPLWFLIVSVCDELMLNVLRCHLTY